LWEDWGACDSKCGEGSRARQRFLKLETHDYTHTDKHLEYGYQPQPTGIVAQDQPAGGYYNQQFSIEDELQKLLQRNRGKETGQFQELVVAFAAGGISLVALLTVCRVSARAPEYRGIQVVHTEVEESAPDAMQ
jgi:hypothetical protein